MEMVTAGFVASVGLTLVLGFALGNGPGTFQATPGEPWVQLALLAVALALLALAAVRGAFAAVPPTPPAFVEPSSPGEENLPQVLVEMETLARRERTLRRELRSAGRAAPERVESLKRELAEVEEARRQRERAREEELDG